MFPRLAKLKGMALDLIFPQWCVGCGREGSYLCSSCTHSLSRVVPPICPKCGRPQPSGMLCPGCVSWQAGIDGIRSPYRFEGVMRQAIYQLKYRNLRGMVVPMAKLLYEYLTQSPVPGEVLVPVPLHHKRLRERGYNQAGLLASELGRLTNMPVVDNCLIRMRHTTAQARTLNVEERRLNVVNAFGCRDSRLQGKQVLLIDDVATSGATLNACATALKADNAISVWGLVLAKEI